MIKLLSLSVALVAALSSQAQLPSRQLSTSASPRPAWDMTVGGHVRSDKMKKSPNKESSDIPSMVWGYCDEPAYDGPCPAGMTCYSLIGITDEQCEKFDGCKIESVIVAKGYYLEEMPKIDIVLTKGRIDDTSYQWPYLYIDSEPLVQLKDVEFPGEEYEWVEFKLPEPYTIHKGEPFYAGWAYTNVDDYNCPLVTDLVLNNDPNTSWMGGDDLSYNPDISSWMFWSNETSAGSNCIRLRISGDNLPANDLVISGVQSPRYTPLNEDVFITLDVTNGAANEISSIDVECVVLGGQIFNQTISGLSLAPGELTTIPLDPIHVQIEGCVQIDVNVKSVNGEADPDPSNNSVSVDVLCLADGAGYPRKVVVEEGTGTWCGNCPRGAVAMRRMAEKYPDTFLGIAAHRGDRMEIPAYSEFLGRYIDAVGYPYCAVDRVMTGDPGFVDLEAMYLKEAEVPALASVSIASATEDDGTVTVTSEAEFAADLYGTNFGWAYVITENEVGPYEQTNYYTDGSLEGWDESESYVNMLFDEVARAADSVMGAEGSIPTTLQKGEIYSNTVKINARNVKDWKNAYITAMIVNIKTGYIENAARLSFKGTGIDGLNSIGSTRIVANNGTLTLVGGDNAEVYTMSGMKIASLRNGQSANTGSGIFIVRSNGKAVKTVVR